MSTVIHPGIEKEVTSTSAPQPGGGRGGGGRVSDPDGDEGHGGGATSQRSSTTGIWLAFCAIAMAFAAFSSAMIVRRGSTDWQHIQLPWLLYANALPLMASSITFEIARRRTAVFMRTAGVGGSRPMIWMVATLALGLLFVAAQFVVWQQLAARGLYLSTNPNSSFLYLLTAFHAVHVLGGLFGITLVMARLGRRVPTLRKRTIVTTCYYWHFMGLLWIYLLLLFRFYV